MLKFKLFFLIFIINVNCFSQSLVEYIKSAVDNEAIGEYDISLSAWDNAIKIDSSNCGWLYFMRAGVKWRKDDIKGAIEDNLYAIEHNLDCDFLDDELDIGFGAGIIHTSTKRDILFYTAKLQSSIGEYTNAMINFNKVIKKTEYIELWEVYWERGKLKSSLSDFRGAISDFNLALNINSQATIIYSNRGYCKLKLKDYLGSVNDYTKVIQKNPNNSSNAYYNRGLARIYLKQLELGCKDLSKAGEQGDIDAYEVIKDYCQ